MTPNWDDLKPAPPEWDSLKPASDAGGLRDRALNSLPPDLREYAQKALSQLVPSGQQNAPGYSPYKSADPNNMPNDAINPVGTDAQMTAGLGAAGAVMKGLGSIPRPAPATPPPAPPAQPPLPFKPPTLGPTSPIGGAPPSPGVAAQQGLLQQVAKEAQNNPGLAKTLIHGAGHFVPGGGILAPALTHFLKL